MSESKPHHSPLSDIRNTFPTDQALAIRLHETGHGINKYPAKSHARRVAQVLGVSKGLIVLQATVAVSYPASDQPVPFRQNRYFYYLTGCNEPGCYVTYDIQKDRLVLWLPPIDKWRVVWSGRGSTVEEALEKYDVDDAQYLVPPQPPGFAAVLHRSPAVFYRARNTVLQLCIEAYACDQDELYLYQDDTLGRVYFLHEQCRDVQNLDHPSYDYAERQSLQPAIDACRVIKDEYEIDLIRKANRITAAAHRNVLTNLHLFTSEAQVEAAYMAMCISNLAREQAYAPIAGSGPNAAELHYVRNDEYLRNRQMLVLDAGCEWERYASDVTRTMPVNPQRPGYWPSEECEQIYMLVEKMQEACIREMKPGNKFTDIVRLADEIAIDGLLELGILKGKKNEILRARTIRGCYPHGLGHHLGLEVHDVSAHQPTQSLSGSRATGNAETMSDDASFPTPPAHLDFASTQLHTGSQPATAGQNKDSDPSVLRPGMVITIEPGIYFNAFLLENFFLNDEKQSQYIDEEVLKRYMPVGGVRIEDDILITKDGHENLTTAPKGEAMLKCIRDGAATEVRS